MLSTQAKEWSQEKETPMHVLRENVRTFRISAWLGWQIESNWADPLVFFIFAVLRPMATALILLVMYNVIAGGKRDQFFDYLFVSNAFFVLVLQVLVGMSWTIIDDRENYKMLKYVYTSPARKISYLAGRALAKALVGMFTTLMLLTTGSLFLGVHIDLGTVQWGWLVTYFVLGMTCLGGLGMILAGLSLVMARHGEFIGEVVGGMLLLFSGAYFPPDILPPFIKQISMFVPITYWLEGMRRALEGGILTAGGVVGSGAAAEGREPISPMLAAFDNWQLFGILLGCALVFSIGSYVFYVWVENIAKERGMIDRLTGY